MSTFCLKIDDVEYAVPVECPHRKGWLSRGKINRTRHGKCFIVCPLHFSTFELPGGQRVSGPVACNLAVQKIDNDASTNPGVGVEDNAKISQFCEMEGL